MIEIKNLYAGYREKEILHNVSMTFEQGKITALIGPNGCGKSTLLKTVVRIHSHSGGEILVNGISNEKWSSAELAKQVAFLPQSKKAPDISVLKMVLHGRFAYLNYPRKYRPQDYEIAKQALCWTGMEEWADEQVSHLSGGMQQKVYIAMALAQDADTILMDEPTTYLDIAHQLRVMDMARKLADQGKAVVMVLHDLSQALRTADYVYVLERGKNVQAGTPETVFESGKLQSIFGVQMERTKTSSGWHYLCS